MKNQYVGDINDYQKYDLLQLLSQELNLKILVVWMLTQDDGGPNGRLIEFLDDPKNAKYNPPLFSALYNIVKSNKRNVKEIENLSLFANKQKYEFVSEFLDTIDREKYFETVRSKLNSADLVFFDPDNGMEPKTKKDSPKYLYWNEVREVLNEGKDVLFIQFYNRIKRINFVQNKINDCVKHLGIQKERIALFWGRNVVFFYISHDDKDLSKCVYEWGKWETGRCKITANDGKTYHYSIDRNYTGDGYSLATAPIECKIYSELCVITPEDISSEQFLAETAEEYILPVQKHPDDFVGKYYDKDGFVYYTLGKELYRFKLQQFFKDLYDRKINAVITPPVCAAESRGGGL